MYDIYMYVSPPAATPPTTTRDQEKPLRSPSWSTQGKQKQNENAVQAPTR